MKTGIFSGSFNPIHTGHLILASYLHQYEGYEEIWLTVSPHNPLRERFSREKDIHRINMVKLAIEGIPGLQCCDIEFSLPQPSYSIHTLDTLKALYPDREFTLIIGADNWLIFDKWKEYKRIINENKICIYPRRGCNIDETALPSNVYLSKAPIIEISSTFIRDGISKGLNMNFFLTQPVYDYIRSHQLYTEIK